MRRKGAELHMLILLLSFGGSVALTRIFLALAGYPQLGGGSLHIAHVLWGGLLLFLAALLPLLYANRRVYHIGSLLAGVGVGLFIDEVGKFITANNDYFTPAAAPIIYASFMLTVLIYLQVRRARPLGAREALYQVLDELQEVLDHDLDPQERAALEEKLRFARQRAERPELRLLAERLLEVVSATELHLSPEPPALMRRGQAAWQAFAQRWLTCGRLRMALTGALLALGADALLNLQRLLTGLPGEESAAGWLARLMAGATVDRVALAWFAVRVVIEAGVGLLLVTAALLLLGRRARTGLWLAYGCLVFSLAGVNLLVFYFDQFATVVPAMLQFIVLLGVLRYRRKCLPKDEPHPPAVKPGPR